MKNRQIVAALCLALGFFGYKAIAQQKAESPAPSVMAVVTFDQADANKDGFVTPDEAVKVPGVGEQFSRLDVNKDGKLDPKEYAAQTLGAGR